MSGGFRRLAVYEKCVQLSDELWDCVQRWTSFERWTLGMQVVRAVDSVGANIAEAGVAGLIPIAAESYFWPAAPRSNSSTG